MSRYINPLAVGLVAWCSGVGAVFGTVFAGFVTGLTVVILAEAASRWEDR